VQHFIPTHNIMTNSAYPEQCRHFMERVPLFKLWMNPSIMIKSHQGQEVIQNVLISCDFNDQFGLHKVTQTYVTLLSSNLIMGFGGYWVYDLPYSKNGVLTTDTNEDGYVGNGHFYDFHDVSLTAQWFSDTFRTFAAPPQEWPKGFKKVGSGYNLKDVKFDEFGLNPAWIMTDERDAKLCFAFDLHLAAGSVRSGDEGMSIPGTGSNVKCEKFYHQAEELGVSNGVKKIIEDALRFGAIHADLDEFESNSAKGSNEMDVHKCWVGDAGPTIGGQTYASFKKKVAECSLYCGSHTNNCDNNSAFTTGEEGGSTGIVADATCDWYTIYYTQPAGGGNQVHHRRASASQRKGVFRYCDAAYTQDNTK